MLTIQGEAQSLRSQLARKEAQLEAAVLRIRELENRAGSLAADHAASSAHVASLTSQLAAAQKQLAQQVRRGALRQLPCRIYFTL